MSMSDRIFAAMMHKDFGAVRSAYIARAKVESGQVKSIAAHMAEQGYEAIDAGGAVTDDGREIVRVRGQSYALRPDVHAERLAAAFKAAKKAQPEPETKSVVGTESLSAIVCPKCGDSLQHTAVCPSCAAGKLGYRHRYTCVCCGVDLISKELL